LVGFWLSYVGCIGLLWLASKIGEKVKSWLLSNLGGEVSEMNAKGGVKILGQAQAHMQAHQRVDLGQP